jgi:hypothetical protein
MQNFTVTQGDHEEFAIIIKDPSDLDKVLDMSVRTDWQIEFRWVGPSTFSKTYVNGTLIANASHADPDIPDGSVKVVMLAAETAALPVGKYELWICILVLGTNKSHIKRGGVLLNIVASQIV